MTEGIQTSADLSGRTDVYGVKYFLTLLVAILYGGILSQLPTENFFDHVNYLAYAENSWDLLSTTWAVNPLIAIANEPIWLLLNAALSLVLSPDATVRLIIFVSATTVAFRVLRVNPKMAVFLLVFLLLPQVMKNFLNHVRQGAAIALFLHGWFLTKPRQRWAVMALTPFVHSSFGFVLLMLGLVSLARRFRLAADLRFFVFSGFGIAVGVGIGWIATLAGARQADQYTTGGAEVSGLGFILWLTVFTLMCLQGRRYLREHIFECFVILFYLATYFLTEVTARIFESGMILVLLALLGLTGSRRHAAFAVICVVGLLQWVSRLGQPLLGFGLA